MACEQFHDVVKRYTRVNHSPSLELSCTLNPLSPRAYVRLPKRPLVLVGGGVVVSDSKGLKLKLMG